jgi:ubiquinone/menaquinone biosynthesis C-methylase UbiE
VKKIFKIEGIPNPGARIYSLIAAQSPLLKDFYREVAEEVCSRISSGRMLDVGTGPGYLPFEIAKRSQSLEIAGIDISPAMVKIAERNAKNMGVADRVKFQLASAENLPFEDGYFNFVVSTGSFHHWLKPIECLKEIQRVLQGNSEAWIYDLRRDTAKEVDAQLRKKYGWFLSFFFLKIIRAHSSVLLREIEEILSSSEISFSKKGIEDKGVILKMVLLK